MKKPDCPPKTECWCETHKNHPDCITLEIDSFIGLSFLIVFIMLFAFNKQKK